MIRDNIIEIISEIWPGMIITSVMLISMRIVQVIVNKKEFVLYREIINLSFVVYIMGLYYAVTFSDVSWSSSNFIPFREMLRYEFGSTQFFKNIVGNIIIFFPFGFFAAYYIKLYSHKVIILLSLLISATIETTQYLIGRVFDVDDIMLNVVGALVGFYFFVITDDIMEHSPRILKKNWFYNIIIVLILSLIVLYLFKVINIGV